jgi:hypothetical protein
MSPPYHDTNGQLVRDHVKSPLQLAPMATTGFVIERNDAHWQAYFSALPVVTFVSAIAARNHCNKRLDSGILWAVP